MMDNEDKEVRDMFAAFALMGLIIKDRGAYTDISEFAFKYADAMMKERTK